MNKQITLDLKHVDGNAYCLMGAFQSQARKEGRTLEEIETVINEAMKGDYEHLVSTLQKHCK